TRHDGAISFEVSHGRRRSAMSVSARQLDENAEELMSSRIPGFYRLDVPSRHRELMKRFSLSEADIKMLRDEGQSALAVADKMVENCIGVLKLPIGLGLNFRVNDRDYVVPMVIEEPSVIAAVSNIARLVYAAGGFRADADQGIMVGQVQMLGIADFEA